MSDGLARAELAVARAGHPRLLTEKLDVLRGALALQQGQLETAITAFREAIQIATRDPITFGTARSERMALIHVLLRAGRSREASDEVTHVIEAEAAVYGSAQQFTWVSHLVRAEVMDQTADYAGALAVQREWIAGSRDRSTPRQLAWNHAYQLELALRSGQSDEATEPTRAVATMRALTGQGTTPALRSPGGVATARRAGLFEAMAFVTEREAATGTDQALDDIAILAFERGDEAAMAHAAARSSARCAKPHACSDWLRFSRWLAVLADARAHRAANLDEQLATLEADYGGGIAATYSGIVLASLGRWHDARIKLEAARATPNVWAVQAECDLAEVDAWLGLAQIEDGAGGQARPRFEESLVVLPDWVNGWSYMTPFVELALARLLWDGNTDRPRARLLAERARDGFARLGTFREPERQQSIRWLEAHPL